MGVPPLRNFHADGGPQSGPSFPSSIALICKARYFELMRHWARPPAMNHRPSCAVRLNMLLSSPSAPMPQTGPMRSTIASPSAADELHLRIVAGRQNNEIGRNRRSILQKRPVGREAFDPIKL